MIFTSWQGVRSLLSDLCFYLIHISISKAVYFKIFYCFWKGFHSSPQGEETMSNVDKRLLGKNVEGNKNGDPLINEPHCQFFVRIKPNKINCLIRRLMACQKAVYEAWLVSNFYRQLCKTFCAAGGQCKKISKVTFGTPFSFSHT